MYHVNDKLVLFADAKWTSFSFTVRSRPLIARLLSFQSEEDGFEKKSQDTGSNLLSTSNFDGSSKWSVKMCDILVL